jgi:hypothetical protein
VATAKTQTSASTNVYTGGPGHKGQFVVGTLFAVTNAAEVCRRMVHGSYNHSNGCLVS